MPLFQLIILAFGLSMDSFAIAMTSGAIIKNHRPINVMKIAGMLAFIQMSLIAIGWRVGINFISYLQKVDHWIAFGILTLIGGKILYENFKEESEGRHFNPLSFFIMLSLAVAASIDAVAAGLSLSCVHESVISLSFIVGLVTLLLSGVGVILGCKLGCIYTQQINRAGGIVLILIAVWVLAEHTLFQSEVEVFTHVLSK